ncbi:hypothetical protein DEFDS_P032 (plasmid) [Deferribacter desulfuricans SSM1]|uniref:TraG P-loop domain-containing protein n=1 Tax=Deferribacter desulfuricans (strain DSM 14783 / JCM 11476 / NBRC 101012 / SSM1) TaxID=639282 RepID=D3PEL8_DEFDS|nr:hypothetical protein [Deferribacter desulfuricans]BAI81660.1 hypothetical protein DEFDS_P032 [Deferribacter desulfuricans SSM1]
MLDLFNIADIKDFKLDRFVGLDHRDAHSTLGLFFFTDGSIGFALKVKGAYQVIHNLDQLESNYQKIVSFYDKLVFPFSKNTGATYQYIYTPDFDYSDLERKLLNSNFFKTDKEAYESYAKNYGDKIDEIKRALDELNININYGDFDEQEKAQMKKEIAQLRYEYDTLLKNFISSTGFVNYLEKFYNALNLRTVELLRDKIIGKARRHRYYLFVRYYPNYKEFNFSQNDLIEDINLNYFDEDKLLNQTTYQILKNVITHAIAAKSSLPFGGELLDANQTISVLYRFLGLPAMEYNSLTPTTRLFPYKMELLPDKLIVYDVPSPNMPVFDNNGHMINHKLKDKTCDILLKLYSLTSLPDPGQANYMLPTDFLARLKGDYSVTWSIFREDRKETRKRINMNRRTFEFLVDIPFLGKRLFSEEAVEIKRKMFKFAELNTQLGSFGDLFRVATHVTLRKAIPHEHITETYISLKKDNSITINTKAEDVKLNKEYVKIAREDKDIRNIVYKDERVFTIQTDYFRKIGGGVSALEETDSMPEIFFNSAYPFTFRAWDLLERYQPMYSASIGAFLPMYEEPEGMTEPGLIVETYSGIYNLNHFALPGAKNYAVIGATGSGKTFFQVNRNIVGYGKGVRIIFVDRGGALFRAVKFLNGQNIKLRTSYNYEAIKDKLNPFVLAAPDVFERTDDYDEYKQSIREFMVTLLCSICQMENENIAIRYFTELLDDLLFIDFNKNKVISETTGEASAQVTFSDIYNYLLNKRNEPGWSEFLSNDKVLSSIKLFTKGQLYGSLFDGIVRKPLITSPAVAIDFEGLESELVSQISLAIINSYIWNVVLGTGGFIPALSKKFRFTDIALDEVWSTLKSLLGQRVIETGMRTLRKHGAGMGLLTQTAADIGNSPIRDAVVNNIQNLYVLASNEADVINYKEVFGFNDVELEHIKHLKSEFGYYNDIYYKYLGNAYRHLSSFVKLRPLPLTYAIVTSDADDKTVINILQQEFAERCGDSENISYMKAVLLFSKLFPNSVRRYPRYAEIMEKVGNNLNNFVKHVLNEINFRFEEFNLEKELLDINLDVEALLDNS